MKSRWLKVWKNFLSGDRAVKVGVALPIAVIVLGAVMAVAIGGMGKDVVHHSEGIVIDHEGCRSEGIVIDYGNYDTVWTRVDPTGEVTDPVELLKVVCDKNHATPTFKDGKLVEIKTGDKTVSNDSGHEWGLWYVKKGECDFEKSDTYKINVSDYTVVSWAYTANEEKPTVAVDASGTSIYGRSQPNCVAALSPACKYIVEPMGKYSVIEPSLDRDGIMGKGYDIVFCDGSIPLHYEVANDLRNSGVDCVVTYNPKTLKDVVNNIFIVGTAVGYDARDITMKGVNKILSDIKEKTCATKGYKTLIALGPDSSPWVAGRGSYANEVIALVNGSDALDGIGYTKTVNGWLQITPTEVMEANPDCIVILDPCPLDEYKGKYKGKLEDMMSSMSSEWKEINAYKNNKIYLFTGDLGMMAQCAGPGTFEFAANMAKVINPGAFGDGAPVPNEINGSNYDGTDFIGGKLIL